MPRTFSNLRPTLIGWIVIALALVSLIQVLWISYDTRKQAECQGRLNQQFVQIIADRGEIADQDRASFRQLIEDVSEATTAPKYEEAFKDYFIRDKGLTEARAKLQYPDPDACS